MFELCGVDENVQRLLGETVRRGKLLAAFAQLPAFVVRM
jgi:hypothetical protein